jgi:hydrogenase maturation protein HypF
VELLRGGAIVAVKGIGGFHLMARADDESVVRELRRRKRRSEKPFALMFPSAETVCGACAVNPLEDRLLRSPEAPIVLLLRNLLPDLTIAAGIAPGNPSLGVMLPSTPLHHLLIRDAGMPLIATSGNLSDEPLCIDEHEALRRLRGIADAFLVHNRPILRHVDDSIVRVMLDRELVLRRARGFAPLPVPLSTPLDDTLAVGAHLKNTVAVARGTQAFVSQHLGDLETEESYEAFLRETRSLGELYEIRPRVVVSDLHPDYLSSRYARDTGKPVASVQHHFAHVAACMADNGIRGQVLGVAWDGTGFGPDGTVWGGEFLRTDSSAYTRFASFRLFPLPGGDQAIREPRRAALGLLFALDGEQAFEETGLPLYATFSAAELPPIRTMLARSIHAVPTSSVGRLFDAVSALIGLRSINTFEGQAAMELEWAAQRKGTPPYRYGFFREPEEGLVRVDWGPLVRDILADVRSGVERGLIASRFHATLAAIVVAVARAAGETRVVLTGGCFQNRLLTEMVVRALENAGFTPYWHQRIPPNDGGIAVGQLEAFARAHKAGDAGQPTRRE